MAKPATKHVASVALILCLLAGVTEALRDSNKKVTAYCIYDSGVSELTMTFLADYNGDPVDKVLPLTGRTYDRANNNEAPCSITDHSSDQIQITSKIYTDNSQGNDNACGARKTINTQDEYEWTIELREHWLNKVYTEIDRRYLIQCKILEATSNMITTSIKVYGEDKEDAGMRYRADNEMSVLEYRGNDWRKWTGGVNGLPLNQEIRFRVQSKLDKDYEPYLFYYGCAPFLCTRSVSSNFNSGVGPTVDFIGLDSCPTAQDPFGLTTGFTRADVDVRKNGLYNMETEAFVFASGGPDDYPEALRYFVRCYLKYCHGNYDAATPANNDQVCENPCLASQSARKKRSTSLYDHDQVVLTIDVDTSRSVGGNNEGQDSKPEKVSQTTLISIIAVIGALIVVMAIVVTCLLLVARRRRYQSDDTSSEKSTKVLPVYQLPKA